MNVGKIEAVKVKRGAVYMHLDDGTYGQYANGFRIMEKYGLRGTISVITSNVGTDGRVTWSQLREMEKAGWVVCSHTHTHKNLRILEEENRIAELIYELQTSQKELFDRGFYFGSKCLVAPFGGYNEKVDAYVKKYYAIVRTNNTTNRTTPSFAFPQSHHRRQYYLSPYNTDTFETIKGWIDNVIATKTEISIAWHRIEQGNEDNEYNVQPELFEQVCAYLKEKQDNGEIYVLNWLDSMVARTMNPIDSEGLEYIVSDGGDVKILRLPIEVDNQ